MQKGIVCQRLKEIDCPGHSGLRIDDKLNSKAGIAVGFLRVRHSKQLFHDYASDAVYNDTKITYPAVIAAAA